jgi:membrane-bound lytic murein transglycosylase A
MRVRILFFLPLLLLLSACAGTPLETAPLTLSPASYDDLPGWTADHQIEALAAFGKSCAVINAKPAEHLVGADPAMGTYAQWQAPCRALAQPLTTDARTFFETWFTPWRAENGSWHNEGLFTGYYEAALHGSRVQHDRYQYPLRVRPQDLVMVELGDFRPDLKGQRIAGRVIQGQLKPFEDRASINAGRLPNDPALRFVWVDNPVDAFFLQVQGSGRIILDDGSVLRVGYDGQNGWPYTAIGRELIKRGELDKDHVSMQAIRAWLAAHPGEAYEVMNLNRSYVFFKVLGGDGPLGAQGVVLTPGRSLAVDHARIPYGIPIWVDADAPMDGAPRIDRLVVAQDTGGAIRGPIRGDLFWGYGPQAEQYAGQMKAQGRMWLLLPKPQKWR